MPPTNSRERWICLTLKKSHKHPEAEIARAFQDDLIEFVAAQVVGGDSDAPNYGFVHCRDYDKHIDALRRCSAVEGVMPSYESPGRISETEVRGFSASITERSHEGRKSFLPGDIVFVKSGYLCNLRGVVEGRLVCRRYAVSFRFFSKTMTRAVREDLMQFERNPFDNRRFPVIRYGSTDTARVPVGRIAAAAIGHFLAALREEARKKGQPPCQGRPSQRRAAKRKPACQSSVRRKRSGPPRAF